MSVEEYLPGVSGLEEVYHVGGDEAVGGAVGTAKGKGSVELEHLGAPARRHPLWTSRVVAGQLGHSSTRITQDVYQHRVEQLDRAAAEKVAGLIFEAGETRS